MSDSELIVIIPAYNEQNHIAQVIQNIGKVLPSADIVVINDGSEDRTAEIALQSGTKVINLPYNMGYGTALQTGYIFALENGYQYLAQIDADGQHDPVYILDMLSVLQKEKVDLVIGSRFLVDTGYKAPFAKRMGMHLFGVIASTIMKQKVSDPTSGYQTMNRKVFRYCARDVYPSDFADADVLIMLFRAGFKIREVPVQMNPSANKESRYMNMYSIFTPIYYVFKISLAIFVTLLRKPGEVEEAIDL